MSDVWASTLHRASYGGVEFDCLTLEDSVDRALVMHTFPRRDGGEGQDMGSEPRSTVCRAIFWERAAIAGEATLSSQNHLLRFQAWHAATQAGKAQEFVHSITGSYKAFAVGVRWQASGEDRNVILADVTFVEDTTQPAAFQIRTPVDAGVAAVAVQADLLEQALADIGMVTDVIEDVLSTVEGWESDLTRSSREVDLELASLTSRIDRQIRILGLEESADRHLAWKAFQFLNYRLILAAEAFRQSEPQLIELQLLTNMPLRVLTTEHYGAADSEARYQEITRLNDIEDPSLILAGTILRAPSPTARAHALRRTS